MSNVPRRKMEYSRTTIPTLPGDDWGCSRWVFLIVVIGSLSLFLNLFFLARSHYLNYPIDWVQTKEFSEFGKNVFEVIAILVAGIWTYYLFIRGRIHKQKLALVLTGRLKHIDGRLYLITSGKITNVGNSDFKIKRQGCIVKVGVYRAPKSRGVYTPEASQTAAFFIFPNEDCLEPTESIENQRITTIDDEEFIAVGIELYVESLKHTWYTSAIVEKPQETPMYDKKRNDDGNAKKHYPTIEEESERRRQEVEETTRRENQEREEDSE